MKFCRKILEISSVTPLTKNVNQLILIFNFELKTIPRDCKLCLVIVKYYLLLLIAIKIAKYMFYFLQFCILEWLEFFIFTLISWRSVLLVEVFRVSGENNRLVASHWQTLSHDVVSFDPTIYVYAFETLYKAGEI